MKRIAIIDKEKCKAPEKCDYLCMKSCPIQKNNLPIFNILENKKPSIDESYCIGCGICVKKCPFDAIIIINLTKEPEDRPVFQYGPNTFRLYRLPVIKENNIIGIIGRNGIGKSTAINIIAGLLKPNFGYYDKDISNEEIIRNFRGSELQKYFQRLYNKEINISYKPQDILKIKNLFKNLTVREFLSKVVDVNSLSKYNINNILDRKIENLSGGELQKVIYIYSVYKEHNLLLIDELTNYLDIYERLNIFNDLSDRKENDTIIIIDHDLLFLDSISDIVHIVYGIRKAYGVFSHSIGAKEGVNQYLNGFIRRENLKIRDKPIRLDVKSYTDIKLGKDILYWENININLGGFSLDAEKGNIKEYEILGIIGRNGIGKSTFMNALVGGIRYNGTISRNVSISYKPQYFEFNEDITVNQFLSRFNDKYRTEYNEYLTELDINNILDRKIENLSGGESQLLYTFATLIKDADLYLFDEPFANLDIEQRLLLSKIIRDIIKSKGKAGLIIDHDLLFLNWISDRILVFLGEPGKYGKVNGPYENKEALNLFLKEVNITMRLDKETNRPRINKLNSRLDLIQKEKGIYIE
ncbi:ATPase [Nanobdella aerobiophila]|uniref:ATPase n=1 Tax=Nanobdella aerobiophila TaxID=2586965 RepID=A0A915SS64_9ARCH|nr:ribosome biogenesis/translation initiation ATPase RLI [Nanobdella aerobiophila]BBL45186.1 ATPase [Nanobdella aerobiophila]